MKEFELIAKTFQGLEEVLAKELTDLGANNVQIGRRMVSFTGDKAMMYKANFSLRTALRVLKPIVHFQANNPDEVYEAVKAVDWSAIMDVNKSFCVDAVVFSTEFRHSQFVAYRVKDAIVDYFREKTSSRPNVKLTNPDLYVNIHIAENQCTLSLDSSGESLHRRGYRQGTLEAPLNEVLAAGMILMTGWKGQCDLIDPMCGSGTIPIEAALIARNIAPGVFRQEYAFEKWNDFDKDLFEEIYNDDSQECAFNHHIFGYDIKQQAQVVASRNAKAAGVTKDITLEVRDFADFTQPEEKSLIITNPPYGERITTDDLLSFYEMIGRKFKHEFKGNEAWVLSYREECFAKMGLKPSVRIPLYNGSLECEFRKYEMFEGKFKEFRAEGSALDKSERPAFSKPLRGKTFRNERRQNVRHEEQVEPVDKLESLSQQTNELDELEIRYRKMMNRRKAVQRERLEYGKAKRAQMREENAKDERKPKPRHTDHAPYRKDRSARPTDDRQKRREDRKRMFSKKDK